MSQKRYSFGALISAAIGSFVLAAIIFHTPVIAPVLATNTPSSDGRPLSFSSIARKTMPVVVNISTTTQRPGRTGPGGAFGGLDPLEDFYNRFFGEVVPREAPQRSLGSGILISKEGEILTNYHVVKNADVIKVKLSDQTEHEAWVVGKDEKTDLALIRVGKGPSNLPVARWGTSASLDVGDWVVAIGNPFGLELTVTAGIVSAKGRVIGAGPYDNFIQTDASINPGNSAAPGLWLWSPRWRKTAGRQRPGSSRAMSSGNSTASRCRRVKTSLLWSLTPLPAKGLRSRSSARSSNGYSP